MQRPGAGGARSRRCSLWGPRYGMKMPCTPKSVLGLVLTRPSGPPSEIWIWLISTTARLPSFTAPGTVALADVFAVHVPPIAVLAVDAQVAFTGNGMSTTVAGSVPPPVAIPL